MPRSHQSIRRAVRRTGFGLAALAALCALAFVPAAQAGDSPRQRISFNAGWRFIKGDPAGAEGNLDYQKIKAWILPTGNAMRSGAGAARPAGNPGADVPYTQPAFDDSAWRALDLPHDWGIEGPFKQEYPGGTGKLPWWGVGWYRKHFKLSAEDKDKRIFLDLDGAMAYSVVWLNGKFVGGWPYGYASYRVDLTPYIKAGAENVLAIRLDNPPNSSRWYPGGGIYRNVWLVKTSPVHMAQWGHCVTMSEVSGDKATVQIKTTIENPSTSDVNITAITKIYEIDTKGQKQGSPVFGTESVDMKSAFVPAGSRKTFSLSQSAANPKLWSIEHPNLYVAVTTIEQDGKVVDQVETPFGIRTIEFTADRGFLLNGKPTPIYGVCNHHDLGALGAAVNTRALERQVQLLKEMGCNAIRTSHNPPAPELLDLCDRYGMVVMDEAFDCWEKGKTPNDYNLLFNDWHEADLRALVRRDRNHPCVVLWSTGNEIPDQGTPRGVELSRRHTAIVHEEDPTRPAGGGINDTRAGFNGYQHTFDVVGFNYKPNDYARFRQANPKLPLIGAETASCVSSRGEYFFPVSEKKLEGRADFQVSSYDLYAPPWATPPDKEFKGQDQNPFVNAEFVWTGFDYLGEPTPYNKDVTNLLNFSDPSQKAKMAEELKRLGKIEVPSRSSYFGILDLAGFKKDRFYIYQARWRPELPMAHILPHWNWPDRVGQVTPVHVYTSGDEAELFLNGKSLGRRKMGEFEYRLRWDEVKYEPGELKVVAHKKGKPWAEAAMKTTGPAAKVTLAPDRVTIKGDGQDLSFVTATVADAAGLQVPRTKNKIRFSIGGPGEIVATDNGDATSFESFQSRERKAYNGLALVIVRARPGQRGAIVLKAESDGLEAGEVTIKAE